MVPWTGKATLQGFVVANTARGATVYTDEAAAYEGLLFNHEAVKHSVAEYVRGMAHTNGVESFWSMLKRAYIGTYHKLSPKHLTGTCRSSPASTTCASQTPSRKWRPLLPALPAVAGADHRIDQYRTKLLHHAKQRALTAPATTTPTP